MRKTHLRHPNILSWEKITEVPDLRRKPPEVTIPMNRDKVKRAITASSEKAIILTISYSNLYNPSVIQFSKQKRKTHTLSTTVLLPAHR